MGQVKKMSFFKFKKESLKTINFLTSGLEFPIAITAYDEIAEQKNSWICSRYEVLNMNSTDICQWCIRHKVEYQIMYPIRFIDVAKNIFKYYRYIKMKQELKRYVA